MNAHVNINGELTGPFREDQIIKLYNNGEIKASTPCRVMESADWLPLEEIINISKLSKAAPSIESQFFSQGSQILMGVIALLLGGIMLLSSGDSSDNGYTGAFILFVGIACLTKGRVRQFTLSAVFAVLCGIIIYLIILSIWSGKLWSMLLQKPFNLISIVSIVTLVGLFMVKYVIHAKFGFSKTSAPERAEAEKSAI